MLSFLRHYSQGQKDVQLDRTVIGLVGYPNVGKSSTINALFGQKKTPVAATPGRTKHFQTLNISDTLCLCDCPGTPSPFRDPVTRRCMQVSCFQDLHAPKQRWLQLASSLSTVLWMLFLLSTSFSARLAWSNSAGSML